MRRTSCVREPGSPSKLIVDHRYEVLDRVDVGEVLHADLFVLRAAVDVLVGDCVQGELPSGHEDLRRLRPHNVPELLEGLTLIRDVPKEVLAEFAGENGQKVCLLLLGRERCATGLLIIAEEILKLRDALFDAL